MTDRDTFAAAALTGLLTRREYDACEFATACEYAYRYADAMLRERRDHIPDAGKMGEMTGEKYRAWVARNAAIVKAAKDKAAPRTPQSDRLAEWERHGSHRWGLGVASDLYDLECRVAALEKANHDAAPAARAVSDEDRTDKAATSHRRDRSGDTPVTKPMPKEKRAEVSDRSKPIKDGIDPAAYSGDIVQQLRKWRGRHLAHGGELFEAAADEIERLRTVMYRVVDEDCTVAIQNGTFYADGEALFAITDTTKPRNGAARGPDPDSRVWETQGHTPPTQTTPGECSKPREGT